MEGAEGSSLSSPMPFVFFAPSWLKPSPSPPRPLARLRLEPRLLPEVRHRHQHQVGRENEEGEDGREEERLIVGDGVPQARQHVVAQVDRMNEHVPTIPAQKPTKVYAKGTHEQNKWDQFAGNRIPKVAVEDIRLSKIHLSYCYIIQISIFPLPFYNWQIVFLCL